MGSMTGAFHEAFTYAVNHKLPLIFVIADNNKSVLTDTNSAWGQTQNPFCPLDDEKYKIGTVHKWQNVWYYEYKSIYPHARSGRSKNKLLVQAVLSLSSIY